MTDPFQVVREFEAALCEYTGAPYAVTTTSCTMALLLAVAWQLKNKYQDGLVDGRERINVAVTYPGDVDTWEDMMLGRRHIRPRIEIPKRTYVGVLMSIIHAGGRPTFRDEQWREDYQLRPLPIWDCARIFTSGMYEGETLRTVGGDKMLGHQIQPPGAMLCVSFHWNKTLGIQQGGAILHDDPQADLWLRQARFDGRSEGVAPKDDVFYVLGWHCYMAPETAAAGLVRLAHLPKHNEPLPWGPGTDSDYPDLSTLEIFK